MGFSSECSEAHQAHAASNLDSSHEVLEHYWGEHIHMGADLSETTSETTLAIPAKGILLKSFGSESVCYLLNSHLMLNCFTNG